MTYLLVEERETNGNSYGRRRLGTPYVIEIMFAFSPRTPFPFFLALLCFAIAERNRVSLKERSAPPPSPFRRIYQKLAKGHHPNLQKPASLGFRFCIARCVRLCVAMLWPLSLSLSEIEGDGRRKGRGRRKKEEGRGCRPAASIAAQIENPIWFGFWRRFCQIKIEINRKNTKGNTKKRWIIRRDTFMTKTPGKQFWCSALRQSWSFLEKNINFKFTCSSLLSHGRDPKWDGERLFSAFSSFSLLCSEEDTASRLLMNGGVQGGRHALTAANDDVLRKLEALRRT